MNVLMTGGLVASAITGSTTLEEVPTFIGLSVLIAFPYWIKGLNNSASRYTRKNLYFIINEYINLPESVNKKIMKKLNKDKDTNSE